MKHEDHGGKQFTLSVNFRSTQTILDEVERSLAPGFIEQAGLQPRFERLLAREGTDTAELRTPGGLPALEVIDLAGEQDPTPGSKPITSGVATRLDANWFASTVAKARSNGMQDSSIGLLLRSTTDVQFYVCLLYTSPSPRDQRGSRMPSSA